jgi:alkylation response protein AidB-like acyl-CoA dehydrogenase
MHLMERASSFDHIAPLADSVADFVRRGAHVARVRKLGAGASECDRDCWRSLADMGWLGILVPERLGGMGLGVREAAIVAEGLARALVPEPFTATAVLAASVIDGGESEALKEQLLPRIAAGSLLPAVAWQERAGELAPDAIEAVALPFEGGFRLSGAKRFIAAAAAADGFVVSARHAGEFALFWVPPDAVGLQLTEHRLADGRTSGTLVLSDVTVARDGLIAVSVAARAALGRALDRATVVAGAELVGVMARTLELSLDYMRTRVQFGKPIGAFQALQHRAVDLYLQTELAAAVLAEGVRDLEIGDDLTRSALASRVKARASEAALRVTREAIQIHGAIGFTEDCDVGLYAKRALVLSAWLGNATAHRRRYARIAARQEGAHD